MKKYTLTTPRLRILNYACFVVGMAAAWMLTQDWRVLGAVFIASLHFSITLKEKDPQP